MPSVSKKQEYNKKYSKKWYQDNKKYVNDYYHNYRIKVKQEVIDAYGGSCKDCGETDIIVLNIDHIFNDGSLDKKKGITGGHKLYQHLRRLNFPQGRHQVLCFNCNYRKEHYRRLDAFRQRQAT